MLSLISSNSYAALTVTTLNTIQGSAPYLTFDNGETKAMTGDDLLFIKLSNGIRYSRANNSSTTENPIELPVENQTFADIGMLVPATAANNSISLEELVRPPNSYGRDDNGDGEFSATGTGTLSVTITDAYGDSITNRATVLNPCNAPYKVTLNNVGGTVNTLYGDPKSRTYYPASISYYVKPKSGGPKACYAKPSHYFAQSMYPGGVNIPWVDGPASQWNRKKGFIPQDINKPSTNFPTTGGRWLRFNLTIANANASTLSYSKSPSNSRISLELTPIATNVAQIMLTVPVAVVVNPVMGGYKPPVPTTFTIKSGETTIYSFKIDKWFTMFGNSSNIGPVGASPITYSADYCSRRNGSYRIPKIADYTNAVKSSSNNSNISMGNVITTTMPMPGERRIGGGLFAEWTHMAADVLPFVKPPQTNLNSIPFTTTSGFWTSEKNGRTAQFVVSYTNGSIWSVFTSTTNSGGWSMDANKAYMACVNP